LSLLKKHWYNVRLLLLGGIRVLVHFGLGVKWSPTLGHDGIEGARFSVI
jgi:hypothetical protein